MGAAPEAKVDLQTAADELGVHYQTAYRWVRTGRLVAELVDGRYRVERRALDALESQRRKGQAPPPPRQGRLSRQAGPMHQALLAGDEAAARAIVRRLVDEGAPITDVITHVISPPLRLIGQGWHDGELTIWVEHRASAMVERLLGETAPNPRGRRRGTAMVAAVSGDRHSLPTSMAAVALRGANWHVHHLGADMPPDELVRFCREHEVTVAVLSNTNPDTTVLATRTAGELRAAGVPTVLGGPGRSLDDLLRETHEAARTQGNRIDRSPGATRVRR